MNINIANFFNFRYNVGFRKSGHIFVGDLLQLQPVNGAPVFEMISKKTLCHKLGCTTSVNMRDNVPNSFVILRT